ncbi:MAG: nitroreductase family protein [Chloroflexi bacterium]|nr:nitroreductase family protein [Chloroflexota bacterium]
MEAIEALRTRRSCKDFAATPVTKETLLKLIDVARHSPSGANKNPWRFILITERQALDRLSQIARTCTWLSSAPAGISVAVNPSASRYWLEDCSIAAYSICLAATAQGLGAGWAAMHQSDSAEESARRQQRLREVLSLPDQLYIPMVLGLGYPKSAPAERKYPSVDEIVCWESYPAANPW